MNFLNVLQGLFRRKPDRPTVPMPAPGADPADYIGFDPVRGVNREDRPNPRMDVPQYRSPELDQLFADYNKAKETSLHPNTDVDPTQQGLASLFSAFAGGAPLTQQKLFNAPMQNARARSEMEQAGAGQVLKSSPQLIGAYLDRDAQTNKIAADIQKTNLNNTAKQQIALLRTNVQVGKELAKLAGTGQLTLEGATQLLIANGVQDVEQAQATAQAMLQDLQSNPSAWVGLKQGQQDIQRETQITGRLSEINKAKATETDPSAMFRLYEEEWEARNPGVQPDEAMMMQNATARAKLNKDSKQSKIDETVAHKDESIARAKNQAKTGSLIDARAAAERVKSHLPANPKEAAAIKAIADANDAVWKMRHPEGGSGGAKAKGVTATAQYNALNLLTKAQDHADAMVAEYEGYSKEFAKQANEIATGNRKLYDKDGEQITDKGQIQNEINRLLDQKAAAEVMLTRWQREKSNAARHLDDLNKAEGNNPPDLTGPIGEGWSSRMAKKSLKSKTFNINGKTVSITPEK